MYVRELHGGAACALRTVVPRGLTLREPIGISMARQCRGIVPCGQVESVESSQGRGFGGTVAAASRSAAGAGAGDEPVL